MGQDHAKLFGYTNENELFLEIEGMEVTVFKHGIKYIFQT